jgi:hypothetical protein
MRKQATEGRLAGALGRVYWRVAYGRRPRPADFSVSVSMIPTNGARQSTGRLPSPGPCDRAGERADPSPPPFTHPRGCMDYGRTRLADWLGSHRVGATAAVPPPAGPGLANSLRPPLVSSSIHNDRRSSLMISEVRKQGSLSDVTVSASPRAEGRLGADTGPASVALAVASTAPTPAVGLGFSDPRET